MERKHIRFAFGTPHHCLAFLAIDTNIARLEDCLDLKPSSDLISALLLFDSILEDRYHHCRRNCLRTAALKNLSGRSNASYVLIDAMLLHFFVKVKFGFHRLCLPNHGVWAEASGKRDLQCALGILFRTSFCFGLRHCFLFRLIR